jgi:hypothetical protein
VQSKTISKPWVKSVLKVLDEQVGKAVTFLFAVAMAYDTAILVRLHASNPYNISNINNAATHWGPETNYARVLYIIVASVVFFLLLQWINRRSKTAFRLIIAAFVSYTLLVGVMIPQITAGGVDMFGTGEMMAPANGFMHGKELFTNIFFLHGAGVDVLLPRLSYILLNHGHASIGAYAVMLDLVQTVSAFLFVVVLARLLRPTGLFLIVTAWFLGTIYIGFDYTKDIPVYLVILLYWYWANGSLIRNKRVAAIGAIGLISSATILYSIDVGVIMTVIAALVAIGLLFVGRDKDGSFCWRGRPRKLSQWSDSLAIAIGGIVAQLGILIYLGFTNYENFIRMTFFQIPKYQGLEWDYPAPPLNDSSWTFWLPILLAGLAIYMLFVIVVKQIQKNKSLRRETVFALILAALGLLYLRFGVGRPDEPHIDVSVPVIFVASFYIIQLYVARYREDKHWNVWPVGLFVLALLWTVPQPTWNPVNLFEPGNTTIAQIKQFKNLPAQPDKYWLSKNEIDVTNFIKSRTKPSDGIFVMDPEPLYYYLANRPNPTRFYIIWFANPQPYSNEALNSLKKDPPKLVIFSGPSPYEDSDGVPINSRIPKVTSWVLKNYPVKTVIDSTTVILSK